MLMLIRMLLHLCNQALKMKKIKIKQLHWLYQSLWRSWEWMFSFYSCFTVFIFIREILEFGMKTQQEKYQGEKKKTQTELFFFVSFAQYMFSLLLIFNTHIELNIEYTKYNWGLWPFLFHTLHNYNNESHNNYSENSLHNSI